MFDIGGTPIGADERPYVIAEVGINARSDLELAKSHIDAAAEAGADAVKFQTHIADAEMAEAEMERIGSDDIYETVAANEWSLDEHRNLQRHCEKNEVNFLSTPFSVAGVELLDELSVPAIKIGSGEMQNRELLAAAADTGVPLVVSTGMSTPDEVQATYEFLAERTNEFTLLYCVSAYPTEPDNLNLAYIEELREEYGVPAGFSDHSTGVEASVLALGYDVSIIEKHLTIDRRLPGPDQPVSIEPEELEQLTHYINYWSRARGASKPVTEEERAVKEWAHHSLVTDAKVAAGERFDRDNLTTKRPGTGVLATRYFEVLGKAAATNLGADEVVSEDDIV